jgi:arylsulfatase A-like enzyme
MKPHDPFIAPKKYFDLYSLESLQPWNDPADMSAVRKESVGFGDYATAFGKFTPQEWRELFRACCAGTSFMDAQLGRVLDALDKGNLWDNTLVIFVGDHGYPTGERQWWNKNTLFERSCRAPLIIAAPGMKGGQRTRSLVEFVDITALTEKVAADLEIAREWNPGSLEDDGRRGGTEKGFRE